MKKIRQAFKDYFDEFEIELPAKLEEKGSLSQHGWTITYVLTTDAEGQPMLDFLAEHRMTNMRHVRIYHDGAVHALESIQETYSYNPDIPGDEARAEEEFQAHNKRVAETLRAKGLI